MESYFRLCHRFYDLLPATGEYSSQETWRQPRHFLLGPEEGGCSEVEFVGEWQELLRAGLTFEDLLRLLRTRTLAWISEHVFISTDSVWSRADIEGLVKSVVHLRIRFKDRDEDVVVDVVSIGEMEPTSSIDPVYEKLSQLLAQKPLLCVTVDLCVDWRSDAAIRLPWSAATLTKFLETNKIHERVEFCFASFSRDQCQALSTFRGSSIRYTCCELQDEGLCFLEEIANGRGPSKLWLYQVGVNGQCLIDSLSRTKSLRTLQWAQNDADLPTLCQAIEQNESIVELRICPHQWPITEDRWDTLFHSVKNHPALEKLTLDYAIRREETEDEQQRQQNRVRRSRVIVEMLDVNEILRELNIRTRYLIDDTIWQQEIKPRLKRNEYRRRIKALSKEVVDRPILFRAALPNPVINGNPTLMFFLLSKFQGELVARLPSKAAQVTVSNGEANSVSRRKTKRLRSSEGA